MAAQTTAIGLALTVLGTVACVAGAPSGEASGENSQSVIATDLTAYETNGRISVTYTDMSGAATDWIAIAPVGSPSNTYLEWKYTGGGTSGSLEFRKVPVGGLFEARAFYDWVGTLSYAIQQRSAPFATAPTGTVATDSATYSPGAQVTVTYSALPADAATWLAIAPAGAPVGTYLDWKYTGGSASGSLVLTAPATPGAYVARAFRPHSYVLLDESPQFAVSTPVAISTPSPVAKTAPIVVSFSGFQGSVTDWITVAAAGSPPTSYVRWTYTGGGSSGRVTLANNLPVGDYEVRGYFDYVGTHSYTVRASQPLKVVNDPLQGPGPWLTYITEGASADELWAAKVIDGIAGTPIRVNAPLAPNQRVTEVSWSPRGQYLYYRSTAFDIYVVDMSGPRPSQPRLLDGSGSAPRWSPNGRYLARVEESLMQVFIADLAGPTLAWQAAPGVVGAGPIEWGWSSDTEVVYGRAQGSLWRVRVTEAGPEPVSGFTPWDTILGFWPDPISPEAGILIQHRGSGGLTSIGTTDAVGYSSFSTPWPNTRFLGWTPNGYIAYIGQAPGQDQSYCDGTPTADLCRVNVYGCGTLQVFGIPGISLDDSWTDWEAAPNAIAVFARWDDQHGSAPAFFVWRNLGYFPPGHSTCWSDPIPMQLDPPLTAPVTQHAWAPDMRTMLVADAYGSRVADALAASPVTTHAVAVASGAERLSWGSKSMRLFYRAASRDLHYVDVRSSVPTEPIALNPPLLDGDADPIDWAPSPGDDYVAMRDDFVEDGRYELFIADLRGSPPSAPVRVHTVPGDERAISTFAWQPALPQP